MKKSFTEGSVPKALAAFSFPILLTNVLQAAMLFINSLWVGNLLGSTAFGAVTVATTLLTLVLAFVIGLNNATLTIFAQLKGAGDQQKTKQYLSAFVVILLVLSLLISIAGLVFAQPLLVLMNTPPSLIPPAKLYLQINFAGTALLVGYNFIGSALRAFGDSRTPLYFVLMATVLMAVLAPLFMGVVKLGVAGAALAWLLAQSAAFIGSLVYLAHKFSGHTFRLRVPRRDEIATILNQGIPSGLQMLVIYAGITVILSLVNSLGPAAVAGFGAAQRLDTMVLLPATALGTAVNAMAGQNMGAGNWQRVALITKTGVVYNIAVMFAIALALFIWAEPLVRLFIDDADSVRFGIVYLKIIAFFYPFIGFNFIFNGVVRGAGAMAQVLMLNIISLWLLRVPLSYGAVYLFGDPGVALGIGTSFALSCGFSAAYYKWGGWRSKVLFRSGSAPAAARG